MKLQRLFTILSGSLAILFGALVFDVQNTQASALPSQPPAAPELKAFSVPEQFVIGAAGLLSPFRIAGEIGAKQQIRNSQPPLDGRPGVAYNPAETVIVSHVTSGLGFTCTVTQDNRVMCWGDNDYGQLGTGEWQDRLFPVYVSGLEDGVGEISSGASHTCALTTEGNVKCWGRNTLGQLGNNATGDSPEPVDVYGLGNDIVAVASGGWHTCVLTLAGGVKCWGNNNYHELGTGQVIGYSRVPVDVEGLTSGVVGLAAGRHHSCAILGDGGVKCWGWNYYGQLGNGNKTPASTPVSVVGLPGAMWSMAPAGYHTCGLTLDGDVLCWGDGDDGELGNGQNQDSLLPVNVLGLYDDVVEIEAGFSHTCVATESGKAQCWGDNFHGRLGDGTTEDSSLPVDVTAMDKGVVEVSAGRDHTCAAIVGGGVKCWGDNLYGELGDRTTTDRLTPVSVVMLGRAKWTVMAYMSGDDDAADSMEQYVLNNFSEMSAVGSGVNLNIVVQMDRIDGNDTRYEDWTDTRRFYVNRGLEPTATNGISIGEAQMGDSDILRDFMQSVMTDYPAEHYFLVLNGHGSGFTVVTDDTPEHDSLDPLDLRNALGSATSEGTHPLDIIGLDSCIMGNIETASQLIHDVDETSTRAFAQTLIASQDVIKAQNGFDYSSLQELEDHPSQSLDAFVWQILFDYGAQAWSNTLSAVDLGDPYDNLISKVNDFAVALMEHGPWYMGAYQRIRLSTTGYGMPGEEPFIDLYTFADLIEDLPINDLKEKAVAVKAAIGDCFTPDDAINCEVHNYEDLVSHGISIYFPRTADEYIAEYDGGQGYFRFTAETYWDEWLHYYYDHAMFYSVMLSVQNSEGQPEAGLSVMAHDGMNFVGSPAVTDANGQAVLSLPPGTYRFQAMKEDIPYWSDAASACEIPGCTEAGISTSVPPVAVTVRDLSDEPQSGVTVQAYAGIEYQGTSGTTDADGRVYFDLPPGAYRFKAYRYSRAFFSGETDHCPVPGCTEADITVDDIVTVIVRDTNGDPEVGAAVKAYTGSDYTGFYAVTDSQGQAILVLPAGSYRFRFAKNGTTEFWSGPDDHCAVPGCTEASITTTVPVTVTVHDADDQPLPGLTVRVYDGAVYTGYSGTSDAQGRVTFVLPAGSYRFKAYRYDPSLYSTEFWSGPANHCELPGCTEAEIETTIPVIVTVRDLSDEPQSGVTVQVYTGTAYQGYTGTTGADGRITFILPDGSYRFKAYRYSRAFFSGETDHCLVSGCTEAGITVDDIVTVTIRDTNGDPEAGAMVRAYAGSTYTGFYGVTDSQGQAILVLPAGDYRFRFAKNGTTEFWSGPDDHCAVPGCTEASITTTVPVTVTVHDPDGVPKPGLYVRAMIGTVETIYIAATDSQGRAVLTLPEGEYRFRVWTNERFFYSGPADDCAVPGCTEKEITVDYTVTVTVLDTAGNPEVGINVQAYTGSAFAGYAAHTDSQGRAVLSLPAGGYRFRTAVNGTDFWSGSGDDCAVPGCNAASITTTLPVTVTVEDPDGAPIPGIYVRAMNGTVETPHVATTDAQGRAVLTLPQGEYRFRVYYNQCLYWSGPENHCDVPGCTEAAIQTTTPVIVTVVDPGGQPEAGLDVWAMNGTVYAGVHAVTDAQGRASLTLPPGDYRFRIDKPGQQFWSEPENHCTVPGCAEVNVTIKAAVVVTVLDTGGNPEAGLEARAYSGGVFAGSSAMTDAQGRATLWLPAGDYRFRATKNDTAFWSSAGDDCPIPGCTGAEIQTTIPVVVTVVDPGGLPEAGLDVWAMNGTVYAGVHAVTDAQGRAALTLPPGDYRFRIDKPGQQFWSEPENHCTVPGCTEVNVTIKAAVVVTVLDTGGNPEAGLEVRAYSGGVFAGSSAMTDAQGRATLWLPAGDYRFRATKNDTAFWSSAGDDCPIPGCTEAEITTGTAASAARRAEKGFFNLFPAYRLESRLWNGRSLIIPFSGRWFPLFL